MTHLWIQHSKPALVLAPMDGVTDAPMRALLSEMGGFSFCVSEFLRVTHQVYPNRTFIEHVPELLTQCRTPSGTPIQLQLLGGDEEMMAQNAIKGCELGAQAIDINFGCPSPTVNRHDGGASLLRYPERIRRIVSAVRSAVPASIPVSAKLRLGWENREDIFINAEQAALGGASWLTIHARTKVQGYAPPAHWRYIGEIRKRLSIPVVANGEIWSFEDFLKCREETQAEHFMLGRGIFGNPALAPQIAQELGLLPKTELPRYSTAAQDWIPILRRFAEISAPMSEGSQYTARRIKQWLKYGSVKRPLPWFDEVKRTTQLEEIFSILNRQQTSIYDSPSLTNH